MLNSASTAFNNVAFKNTYSISIFTVLVLHHLSLVFIVSTLAFVPMAVLFLLNK